MQEWLVDGYNLLNARPRGESPKSKRNVGVLLAQLAGFASANGNRMLVVLDGAGDPAELDIHHTALFRVVYSQNVSADACIERLLFERRGQAEFTVVTNDRAIANIARGAGAVVMASEAFLEMLKGSQKDRLDTLDKRDARSHGFNRPFDEKLKDL